MYYEKLSTFFPFDLPTQNSLSIIIVVVNLKPTNFHNIKKHVKCTLILEVNYVCCAHITDLGLIAYQRILAIFIQKPKISILLIQKGLLYKEELTSYKAMNFTLFDYPI